MLYDELFYPINQKQNNLLTVREAGKLNADKSYRIERNNSPTNVIAFVERGCLHIEEEDRSFFVTDGQSFFLPNNTKYTIYADKKNPPIMYWINVRGIVFDSIIASFKITTMLCQCTFLDLFNDIISFVGQNNDKFDSIAEKLFSLLLRLRSNEITPTLNDNRTEIENIYEAYICNHIQSEFSLSKMAKELHTSTDTINRIFRHNFGVTPYRYYQNIRIDFAKSLLKKSNLTIEDIAQRLNFTDRNYFSLYFKKKTGYSPAAYRKHR